MAITWAGFVAMVRGGLKSIFGEGKGANQIGSRNQAGSSSGANSPVTVAGRDVNVHLTPAEPRDQEEQIFKGLEEAMPGLLRDLADGLANAPLARHVLVTPTEAFQPKFGQPWFKISQEKHPHAITFMGILGNDGLVVEEDAGFVYRLTERLVRYLKKRIG